MQTRNASFAWPRSPSSGMRPIASGASSGDQPGLTASEPGSPEFPGTVGAGDEGARRAVSESSSWTYRPPLIREITAATPVRTADIPKARSIPLRKAGPTAFGKNCFEVRVATTAGENVPGGKYERYNPIGFWPRNAPKSAPVGFDATRFDSDVAAGPVAPGGAEGAGDRTGKPVREPHEHDGEKDRHRELHPGVLQPSRASPMPLPGPRREPSS